MKPTQVLDMLLDFAMRMDDTRFRGIAERSYGLDWGASAGSMTPAERERVNAAAGMMAQGLRAQAHSAHPFHVTEDMGLLVQGVAAALDESDLFHRDLAPTGVGFVRFDRPMPIVDVRGRTMKGHYLVWGPATFGARPATLMTWFNDSHDPDDISTETEADLTEEQLLCLGRWRWIGADLIANGMGVGTEAIEPSEEQKAVIIAEGDTPGPTSNPVRYVHALWTLLGQSITTVEDGDVERPAARRAKRMGLPPRVSVIALRRSEATTPMEGETLVEWRHRWIQRAHMRWQPYGAREADHVHAFGPAEPDGQHMQRVCVISGCDNVLRRIAIPAAIKGPDGLPLHVPEKVYDLSR